MEVAETFVFYLHLVMYQFSPTMGLICFLLKLFNEDNLIKEYLLDDNEGYIVHSLSHQTFINSYMLCFCFHYVYEVPFRILLSIFVCYHMLHFRSLGASREQPFSDMAKWFACLVYWAGIMQTISSDILFAQLSLVYWTLFSFIGSDTMISKSHMIRMGIYTVILAYFCFA